MKHKTLLAILVYATASNAFSQEFDAGINYSGEIEDRYKSIRTTEQVSDGLIVKHKFGEAVFIEDDLFSGSYQVYISDFMGIQSCGLPAIPVGTDYFLIPNNSSPEIEIISSKFSDHHRTIAPAKDPRLLNTIACANNDIEPIVPYSGLYPRLVCENLNPSIYRNQHITKVAINPVQYDYLSNTVRVYSELTYKIKYNTTENLSNIYLEPGSMFNPNCVLASSSSMDTSDSVRSVQASSGYMIITVPDFDYYMGDFIKWKKQLGYDVTILYDSDWTPDKIKEAVKKQYENDKSLMYLLIVGDHSVVPGVEYELKKRTMVSDLPYICLDGDDDNMPDLYCGRIPVSNSYDLQTVLDKIIWYEQRPTYEASFYKRGVHFALFEDYTYRGKQDGKEDQRMVKTSEDIRTLLTYKGFGINRVYTYYTDADSIYVWPKKWSDVHSIGGEIPAELWHENGYNWDGNASDVVNSVNEGVSYLLYCGHGSNDMWGNVAGGFFDKKDIASMTNYEKLPVVFNFCCLTGSHDKQDCLSRSFLTQKYGGAVGVFAATNEIANVDLGPTAALMFHSIFAPQCISLVYYNDKYNHTQKSVKYPKYGQTSQLGGVLNYYISGMPMNTNVGKYYNIWAYHLFGDPSMYFRKDEPLIIDNITISRNDNTININTNGLEAYIGVFDQTTGKSYRFFGTEVSLTSETTGGGKYLSAVVYTDNSVPFVDLGEEYKGLIDSETRSQLLGYKDNHDRTTVTIDYYLSAAQAYKKVEIIIVDMITGRIISSYPIDKSIVNEKTSINMFVNSGVMIASLMLDGYPASNMKMYISN